MEYLAIITIFLPFLGALFASILGARFGALYSQYTACACITLSAISSFILLIFTILYGHTYHVHLATWINVEFFAVEWGMLIDSVSVVMLFVVSFISLMVHIYSIGYMEDESGITRFMAYLSLFTFFMFVLVTAPNFLQLFCGWEGVGLLSYLLIGYWYEKPSANKASYKAFIMNRLADIAFLIGILSCFTLFGTLDFLTIFTQLAEYTDTNISLLGCEVSSLSLTLFLFFIGAMAKSAQLGFHTWLPDAMEGPTPVSALIHAATMVTAGVFLVVRLSPLYELSPSVLTIIVCVGSVTLIFAALLACIQNDIKRIIAYSTCSQLGYMFVSAGFSAYPVTIFHLTTHAFFKALLFLGAGAVIHAMSGEQNIKKMGELKKFIPLTYISMLIGSFALIGVPFFSGYYSKDLILDVVWNANGVLGQIAFMSCFLGIILTSYYSCRLIWYVFYGKLQADEVVVSHIHEAPYTMMAPIMILSLGSVFAGFIFYPVFIQKDLSFWKEAIYILPTSNVFHVFEGLSLKITLLSGLAIGIGGLTIYFLYIKYAFFREEERQKIEQILCVAVTQDIFDAMYDKILLRPFEALSKILGFCVDQKGIDTYGPHGFIRLSEVIGIALGKIQTGFLTHYIWAMVLGILVMMAFYL